MANTKKIDTEGETPAATPKKKSKLTLLIIIGTLVLSLLGGGAFFLFMKPAPAGGLDNAENKTHAPIKKKVDHSIPPVFYKFDKPFTVKLQAEEQDAYLQTEVQLKLRDAREQEVIKQYEPELKHRMTLAMMGRKASDLATATGVQRLANELRDVANHVIAPPATQTASSVPEAESADNAATDAPPDAPIQSVLFSTFILQ